MTKSKNLGLNLPSRDNTTDLADINVISENFETIDNEFEKLYNKFENAGVINTVSGNPIVLKDSAKAPLQNLKLYGKTTQNGTPTPDAPIELKSVGDSGSFEVGVYGKNLLEITTTTQTINGVTFTVNADKSISASGTASAITQFRFVDVPFIPKGEYIISGYPQKVGGIEYYFRATGEGWIQSVGEQKRTYENDTSAYGMIVIGANITVNNLTFYPMLRRAEITDSTYEPCNKQALTMPFGLPSIPNTETRDEVDFGNGVHSKKVVSYTFDGSENWSMSDSGTRRFVVYGIYAKRGIGVSSHFTQAVDTDLCFWVSGTSGAFTIYDVNGKWADANALKTWLSENKPTFLLELETPEETPLTETELNAYRQLHTNKPNTTIISEADMEISYVADTKLYIDNKIAELAALTLEG
jgi:hypothetical protein